MKVLHPNKLNPPKNKNLKILEESLLYTSNKGKETDTLFLTLLMRAITAKNKSKMD